MVYQTESYDHWRRHFDRDDLVPGMFGENFTITGLGDDEVCIGDRYRIGEAEFEVTQPRVTCFRVGMRLAEPDMPNLLVAHHRPGFYLRVVTEGRVTAGDTIELVASRTPRVERRRHRRAALSARPRHRHAAKAVDIPALSPGWQQSFAELLAAHDGTAQATAPPIGVEPGWSGFRKLRIVETHRESPSVLSIEFESEDGTELPIARPGQYLTLRFPDAGSPAPLRSYSLSGGNPGHRYRISVKREERGLVSRWLHQHAEPGCVLEIAAPRGDFYLGDDAGPVVLVSAGIGVTPVLAMLHALAAQGSERQIRWLHITRDTQSLAFGAEVSTLVASLPNAHHQIFFTADTGRPDGRTIAALKLPHDADAYLCGPNAFMEEMARRTRGRRNRPGSYSHRTLRRAAADQPRNRRCPASRAPPARRPRRRGSAGVVLAQRDHGRLVGGVSEHPRTRRGVRCADPVLLPQRRVPYLRHAGHRGCGRLRPVAP